MIDALIVLFSSLSVGLLIVFITKHSKIEKWLIGSVFILIILFFFRFYELPKNNEDKKQMENYNHLTFSILNNSNNKKPNTNDDITIFIVTKNGDGKGLQNFILKCNISSLPKLEQNIILSMKYNERRLYHLPTDTILFEEQIRIKMDESEYFRGRPIYNYSLFDIYFTSPIKSTNQ